MHVINNVLHNLSPFFFRWSILFFIGMGDSLANSNSAIVFSLFLSYYWVHQVLSNTVQTTVAGTIGTWWFVPEEASSCWSSAIQDSFGRATTYSFGSICLGSLIVAVVQGKLQFERFSNKFRAKVIDLLQSCLYQLYEQRPLLLEAVIMTMQNCLFASSIAFSLVSKT